MSPRASKTTPTDTETTGQEGAGDAGDAIALADSPAAPTPPPPEDAAGWRDLLKSLPARDVLPILQAEKPRAARLLAGFRPSADSLKNPVVVGRIVDEALRIPAFGAALVAASSEKEAKPAPAAAPPANEADRDGKRKVAAAASPMADTRLREQLGKNRALLKEKDERIRALEEAVAQAIRERDAAQADAEAAAKARQAAEAQVERERRLRERDARKAAEEAQKRKAAAPPKPTAQQKGVDSPPPSPAAAPFEEALRRLLSRGKFVAVAEVCREAIVRGGVREAPSATRAMVYALYAEALYGQAEGQSDLDQGAEQDLQAAVAFLDAGDVPQATRSVVRILSERTLVRSRIVGEDLTLLRRLVGMAERAGVTEVLRSEFTRLRIIAPDGFRVLMGALERGGQRVAALRNALALQGGERTIGPDEVIQLPNADNDLPSVTPRSLAGAVDHGDGRVVQRVREAMAELRRTGGAAIADGLLAAVGELNRAAVHPYAREGGGKARAAVVDASNVARHDPDPLALTPPPHVAHLVRMRDYLLRRGFFPVLLIADANLRYHVDDRAAYLALVERCVVVETPSGRTADETLIAEARERDAILVSNDRMSEWGDAARRIERFEFTLSSGGVSLIPT